jgi:hypothetical protein
MRAALVAKWLCEEAIGTFIISGLQTQPQRLVSFSKLHPVLLITKTVEEAEALLNKKENL